MSSPPVSLLDPSLLYRPEATFRKGRDVFRNFDANANDHVQERVRNTYELMHTHQTVDFVRQKIEHWTRFDKAELSMREALERLDALVDESDPDVDVPNLCHAFQTAERLRCDYPELEWLHLTGLIHDAGKLMALMGEPQWAVVGDTFPVGCAVGPSVVYNESSFNRNPDVHHPVYGTKYGMYSERCGLSSLLMSWGHDEYLFRVLSHLGPQCRLPPEALFIIRFHSFYPWHVGGDYNYFANDHDHQMLPWIKLFNRYDLYTKADNLPDVEALWPYYQRLIDRFLPPKIFW